MLSHLACQLAVLSVWWHMPHRVWQPRYVFGRQMSTQGVWASNVMQKCPGVKCHPEWWGVKSPGRQMSPLSGGASNVWASKVMGRQWSRRQKSSGVIRLYPIGSQRSGVRCPGDECPGRQKCINPQITLDDAAKLRSLTHVQDTFQLANSCVLQKIVHFG